MLIARSGGMIEPAYAGDGRWLRRRTPLPAARSREANGSRHGGSLKELRAALLILMIATSAAAPTPMTELRLMAQRGECGILREAQAKQATKTALSDLLSTYRRGSSTAELLQAFRNRANAWGSKLGVDLKDVMIELSPRQIEKCLPWALPVFEYLAGDVIDVGLKTRLLEIYCATDQSRCTTAIDRNKPE